MEIKIGDFGLATKLEFDGEKKRTICGTPNYIAPEMLRGESYDFSVDWWALGVLCFGKTNFLLIFNTSIFKS